MVRGVPKVKVAVVSIAVDSAIDVTAHVPIVTLNVVVYVPI